MTPHQRARAGSTRVATSAVRLLARLAVVFSWTALAVGLPTPAAAQGGRTGTISGRVFDGGSGAPLENATVILAFPDPGDGSEPRQEVTTTGPAGDYEFGAIPAGSYTLSFIKAGYRASSITDFEVVAGQDNVADFPMPPQAATTAGDVLELEAFVVEASVVGEMMSNLELRLESDQVLNLLSAEDLSKYAASDVADALKRVAGVNIVEGQFAIIRGLEDRYSSTLYNGAPVPSPDPDRQSVQLDLFPSEIVGNLVVAKTFAPELPSNSSGGNIDIVTHDYPEDTRITLSAGTGFSDRALDRFIRYDENNPVGVAQEPVDVIESEFGGSIAGREELWNREWRFKTVFNREIDYDTADGQQETRQPARARTRRNRIERNGDLALGDLSLSRGRFDLTQSQERRQTTAFFAGGLDLDEAGDHKLDGSVFYVKTNNDIVQRRERGFFPGFDYSGLLAQGVNNVRPSDLEDVVATFGSPLTQLREEQDPADGIAFYTVLDEHRSFSSERELLLGQLNGDHAISFVEGLHVDWAWNYARAKQDQSALAAQVFFEPDDPVAQQPPTVPTTVGVLSPGVYAINNRGVSYNRNSIDETQHFVRVDLEYERALLDELGLTLRTGLWYEDAERDVQASFAILPRFPGPSLSAITGGTPREVAGDVFGAAQFGNEVDGLTSFSRTNANLTREISALQFGAKLTLFEDLDLQGGVRLEDIQIQAENDAFTGSVVEDSPSIFPSKYLFCDRIDNPALDSELGGRTSLPTGVTYNDEILGIDSPVDPVTGILDRRTRQEIQACINGDIDEQKILPSAGIAYRPTFDLGELSRIEALEGWSLEGLTLRAAYSQTVARPSFRELGYYPTTEPGTDDIIVGNPQLGLSDVESWDIRAEYVWGDFGDLVAVSYFWKTIEDPIEVIVLRDASVIDESIPSNYRTFFNNSSDADLQGVEAEIRLHLGLGGLMGPASEFLDYFSIGGNYTYIDAQVERSQAEIDRTGIYFQAEPADVLFPRYERKRRLFGQPEWIANADISFDHSEWGTKVTLAYFAISEVLDAAGSVALNGNNEVFQFEPDRYTDQFYQLDLVLSQEFTIPRTPGIWTLGASVKNLTDTTRKIIYDQQQTKDDFAERSFRVGRDYSFSLKYLFEF